MPIPIRNDQPIKFIAEPQTIPTLIDVLIDELNYIFSTQSESELASKESTPFILHLNTFKEVNDNITSPCGLTTFNKSLDGSSDFYIILDGSIISDKTSAALNASPLCIHSELSKELSVSDAIKNPPNDSKLPFLLQRSVTSRRMRQDPPLQEVNCRYSVAQHSAMIYTSAKINAFAQQSCYTTIATIFSRLT